MKIKLLLTGAFSVLLGATLLLTTTPVEAKRLGGGMSFGKSYNYSRQAKPLAAPKRNDVASPAREAKPGAQQPGRRGGWAGPLMGLAAGGLLGAMLFGGAFEGINLFDILLIGGLVFGGIWLMRALRRPAPAYRREAPAGGPSSYSGSSSHETPSHPQAADGFAVPEIGSGLKGDKLSIAPAWFDEQTFMSEVEQHFRALHRAWERRDLDEIRQYTTPEFFAALQQQLQTKAAHEPNSEITALQAQLLDLLQDGDKVVAAILFQGEEQTEGYLPEQFAEIWHVEHPLNEPQADWLLAGIRQMGH